MIKLQDLLDEGERDYKAEYKKYGSSTKSKKYRAELNQYNRKKGTYGNGDGKDASHKGGKIVGFESQSKNRGRAEKSRLKKEQLAEVKWPDTQTARLLSQAFDDAKVKVQKVWEKGNHEYIIRVRAKDGWTNVRMELNVISNVIMIQTQRDWVKLGELQPGSRGRKLSKNLKMLSTLPAFGVAGFKGLEYKIESTKEYSKTLDKIAKDTKLKMLSKKDKETLKKLAKLLKTEGGTKSIDGEELLDYLQKRFKMSRKQAIASMKKHKMDVSSIKKESVNEAANKIADIRKILKTKKGKRIDSIFMDVETAEEVMKHYKSLGRGAKERLTKQKIQNIVKSVKKANESVNESDLGLTYKKGKTIKVTHKKSGKELVVVDKPAVRKEYEKIGFYAESINEEDIAMSKGVQKLMKIATDGYGKVGGTTVDSMSANLFKQVYNKTNAGLRERLNKMSEKQLINVLHRMWDKFGKNVSL